MAASARLNLQQAKLAQQTNQFYCVRLGCRHLAWLVSLVGRQPVLCMSRQDFFHGERELLSALAGFAYLVALRGSHGGARCATRARLALQSQRADKLARPFAACQPTCSSPRAPGAGRAAINLATSAARLEARRPVGLDAAARWPVCARARPARQDGLSSLGRSERPEITATLYLVHP